jgi:hypothetical protein
MLFLLRLLFGGDKKRKYDVCGEALKSLEYSMKWVLRLALASILLVPAASMAQNSHADYHAFSSRGGHGGDGAPLSLIGAGLPAFGAVGLAYWLYKRRKRLGEPDQEG